MTFIPNLKKAASKKPRLTAGHRMCPGCGIGQIVKQVLAATENPVIVVNATGCAEICTSPYPYTSWDTPWIHSLFENASAVASGVEAAQKVLLKKGKIDKPAKILAIGGDGATYDIGLQSLSGAVERGHDFVYLCFDNEGYMNTGYQRSSATPLGAAASTSPAGSEIAGKQQPRKDLTAILAAHGIAYAAQSTPAHWQDLMKKAHKAFETKGPAFLNTLSPCPTNWKCEASAGTQILKLAVETNFWPLFEVENGAWKIQQKPKERKPIKEFLKTQKRFRHVFQPGNENLLTEIQTDVDKKFRKLEALEKMSAELASE